MQESAGWVQCRSAYSLWTIDQAASSNIPPDGTVQALFYTPKTECAAPFDKVIRVGVEHRRPYMSGTLDTHAERGVFGVSFWDRDGATSFVDQLVQEGFLSEAFK